MKYYCRRDSFITHRAFCDAFSHENNNDINATQPTAPNTLISSAITNHLYGSNNNNLSLALSQIPPPQIHDQNNNQSGDHLVQFDGANENTWDLFNHINNIPPSPS